MNTGQPTWSSLSRTQFDIAAARAYDAALAPFSKGVYVNALDDEGQDGVRRAYPAAKLARLAELKHRYDPDNAFHLNQNIQPAAR